MTERITCVVARFWGRDRLLRHYISHICEFKAIVDSNPGFIDVLYIYTPMYVYVIYFRLTRAGVFGFVRQRGDKVERGIM